MRIVLNASALCLIADRNGCWIKEWYKRRPQQHTHTYLMTDLTLSEPNDYKVIFHAIQRSIIGWDTKDSYSNDHLVTSTIAVEIHVRSSH
jgi:hypothetical protein